MTTNLSNLSRDGYCIAFSQPEAHTKRFNLIRPRTTGADRLLAANDAASGRGGRVCQPLNRQASGGLRDILWLDTPYPIRR